MQIRKGNLGSDAVARLLRAHLDEMEAITPPGSVHTLDLTSLRSPDIAFWTVWDGDELLGCGALKQLNSSSGEVKSMRTAEVHRGKGVASALLEHIVGEATRRGYDCLNLETGALPEFARARAFYEKRGFEYRGPFGDYRHDSNSVFMTRKLRKPGGDRSRFS